MVGLPHRYILFNKHPALPPMMIFKNMMCLKTLKGTELTVRTNLINKFLPTIKTLYQFSLTSPFMMTFIGAKQTPP